MLVGLLFVLLAHHWFDSCTNQIRMLIVKIPYTHSVPYFREDLREHLKGISKQLMQQKQQQEQQEHQQQQQQKPASSSSSDSSESDSSDSDSSDSSDSSSSESSDSGMTVCEYSSTFDIHSLSIINGRFKFYCPGVLQLFQKDVKAKLFSALLWSATS